MTRLAREIPTDPAHPIKKNGTYKDKHTPLTEKQGTKREREIFIAESNSIHSNNQICYSIRSLIKPDKNKKDKHL
jgi:hypothetical protein